MGGTRERLDAFKNNAGPYVAGARGQAFRRALDLVDGVLVAPEAWDREAGNKDRAERLRVARARLSEI